MKTILEKLPLIGAMSDVLARRRHASRRFEGSQQYWEQRYADGGNSGDGSYRLLAQFKAEVINGFVSRHNIESVIEYGCGDGNQLSLANYPSYLGFDVSDSVLAVCRQKFSEDPHKQFRPMDSYNDERADLTLSLDVIYHLVEDPVFTDYMHRLFDSADRFVIVYASDTDHNPEPRPAHVRHRAFTRWLADNKPGWTQLEHIANRYPYDKESKSGSFADFYIYARKD